MKQGAEVYLIKLDLEPELLLATLDTIKSKIITENGRAINEEKQFESGLRENLIMLREGFFKRITSKPVSIDAKLDEQARYLGIELDELLACCLIRINNRTVLEKYDSKEIESLENSILNTVNEIANDIFKGYSFSWNHGEFVTIFSGDADLEPEIYRSKVINMGERLVQMLKQYFNISTIVGISNPCRGLSELGRGYFEASQACQQGYYSGVEAVLLYGELPKVDQEPEFIDISDLKNVLPRAIELHDLEMISTIFENVVATINEPQITREHAYDLCLQIAYLVGGVNNITETELKEIIGYENSLYEFIMTLDTLAKITNWLNEMEKRLCRFLIQTDEQKNHRLITKAKKYIMEHYLREIGLNEVASELNISPGYFSTIFKQYTGTCFTDYVTEIKIDQAKKLLRESEHKIYEISEMLGYQNAYYFSKVFKKVTGMTPSEFSGK